MLQPCHLLTATLIYVISSKKNNTVLFLVYYYIVWMPLLGLLFSDSSWYNSTYELLLFNIQHVIMIALPWYYSFNGRFDRSGVSHFASFVVAVCTSMFYCTFLIWVSYAYDEDFCGTKCRFPGK